MEQHVLQRQLLQHILGYRHKCGSIHRGTFGMEQLLEGRVCVLGLWRKWVVAVSGARFDHDLHDDGVVGGEAELQPELLTDATQEHQFSELYRQLYTELRTFLVRRLDLDLIDDVLAETFLVLWRRWADLPQDLSGRRAWVYGILRNKMMQATDTVNRQLRLTHRVGSVLDAEDVLDPDDLEAIHEARRLLALLPPGERDALSLMVVAGLSSAETAAVLGCSVSSVTTRVARARKRLRQILTEQDAGRENR